MSALAALLVLLAARDEFPLPAAQPPPDVSISLESGYAGAEQDASGAFWWLTEPSADVWVFNNLDEPVSVDATLVASPPPCGGPRSVRIAVEDTVTVEALTGVRTLRLPALRLAPHAATVVRVEPVGAPCAPGGEDPRRLYLMVRDLEAAISG